MNDIQRRWNVFSALRTARPPDPAFVAVGTFLLAIMVGVIAGLEDSTSDLAVWSRVWRWCAANLVAATVITLAVAISKAITRDRWYLASSNGKALALSYGVYFTAGVLGGLARFLMTLAIDVPPAGASVTHHIARAGAIAGGMILLGFLANRYQLFLEHIRAQQQALLDRIDELDKENQERRRAERVALMKEERLAAMLRTMSDGVILTDRNGLVVLTNQAAEQIISLSHQDATGRPVADILLRLVGNQAAAIVEKILAKSSDGTLHEVETEGSSHRYLQMVATSIAEGPEAGGRVLLIRDVTEEKMARHQSEQEQRLASLGQLAAGIAHDFNNLLTAIIGASEALKMRDDLPEPAHTLAQRVNEAGVRAAHLVQQVLDFSRQRPMSMGPLDVSSVVVNMQEILRHAVPENIKMRLDIGSDRFGVRGNAGQIEQLLMNLVVNGCESMPEGGELRIQISHMTLEPQALPPAPKMSPGDWVVMSVSDSGLGIPRENLDKIFDPFFTTKAHDGGTGLGLAQVHGIVKQHEGFIAVDSRLGKGTTFTIFLPAVAKPTAPTPKQPPEQIPRGTGETILLVEDDDLVLEVLAMMLERLGYRVVTATNGQEALDVYDQRGPGIDLVLTDVTMPVIGGIELFRILRQRDPAVRLIALTGHAFDSESQRYLASGMIEWLEKPPSMPILAQAIRRTLAASPKTAERSQ